jgi:hypothetical protein
VPQIKITLPSKLADGRAAETVKDLPFTSRTLPLRWYSTTYDRRSAAYKGLSIEIRLVIVCYYRFIDCIAKMGIVRTWGR